ncbi:molecular chaperone [Dyella monticola]|uniref:Molecular chaperone n=1 Tax=Dyella monticola TaxID=1927958 RepID=A0A370X442_9GAMM|nr:fimbria/pilus periplasmic chaperone [Dyella monticola]RDS83106.1 molecular chaperone [Dyella monticola]
MNTNSRWGLVVLGLWVASSAGAAGFSVTPLRLDFTGNGSASVEIENAGNTPIDMEVQVMSWAQVDGKDVYADTSDLTVFPMKFTLPPKSSGKDQGRVIRVFFPAGKKGSLPKTEKAYRLYITELPSVQQDPGENIQIRERFGIPVFFREKKASSQLSASVESGGDGLIKVRLTNQGTMHAHLKSITSDPAGIAGGGLDEWYVLPSASHLYSLPISGAVCSQANAKLRISLDQGKPVDVPVSIPSGTCKAG